MTAGIVFPPYRLHRRGVLMEDKNFWYSADKLLSRDCLFNLIVGERGNGKTFDFKCRGVKRFLKGKGQFFYLRRTEAELKESVETFFADIAYKFPGYEFKTRNNRFMIREARPEEEENRSDMEGWEICGYAGFLSSSLRKKSVSYPNVTMIGFDEFLIPGYGINRYMPDEVNLFLNYYETIARMRDVIVIFISNAMNLLNPYFIYFGAVFRKAPSGIVQVQDEIVIEFTENKEYREAKRKTRFGQIVKGTEYERNAIDNTFTEENWDDIRKKSQTARYSFTVIYNEYKMGFYMERTGDAMYVSFDVDMDYPSKYEYHDAKQFRNKYKTKTREIKLLFTLEMMKQERLFFENSKVKSVFYNFLMKVL